MILRSLPITDFSPLDGGVSDRLTGGWVFGSTEALRVNMKSPNDRYAPPPDPWLHTRKENDSSRSKHYCATKSHEVIRAYRSTSSTSPTVRPDASGSGLRRQAWDGG